MQSYIILLLCLQNIAQMHSMKQIHLNNNYCKLLVWANLLSVSLKVTNNTGEYRQ